MPNTLRAGRARREMGFVSNAEEERWLASSEGKTGIVNSIFNAFEKYYKK